MKNDWKEAECVIDSVLAKHRVPVTGNRIDLPREIYDALVKAGFMTEEN